MPLYRPTFMRFSGHRQPHYRTPCVHRSHVPSSHAEMASTGAGMASTPHGRPHSLAPPVVRKNRISLFFGRVHDLWLVFRAFFVIGLWCINNLLNLLRLSILVEKHNILILLAFPRFMQQSHAELKDWSVYHVKKMLLRFMVKQAAEKLKPVMTKSGPTQSRAGMSLSIDNRLSRRKDEIFYGGTPQALSRAKGFSFTNAHNELIRG